MSFRHQATCSALAATLLLAGCGTDDGPSPNAPQNPPTTDLTVPAEVVSTWEAALNARDLETYSALLESPAGWPAPRADADRDEPLPVLPGFRFYPQASDLLDFPWMRSESWGEDEELRMVGHLFDPAFVSDWTRESIDSIEAQVALLSEEVLAGGEIEVTTLFDAVVLWAGQDGATFHSRLVLRLVEDERGFLRIRSMRELPVVGGRGVEDTSWASVKNAYR